MVAAKRKNENKTNEQTKTTEVPTKNMLATQVEQEMLPKSEKYQNEHVTTEATRDSNGIFLDLVDRVVTLCLALARSHEVTLSTIFPPIAP